MRTIAAFILGVLACFIVMHSIDQGQVTSRAKPIVRAVEADASRAPRVSSSPSQATDTATPSQAKPSQSAPTSGPASLTRPNPPSDQQADRHQRPASELIDDMIHSAGDAVMGNPLLAAHQELQAQAKDQPWSTLATASIRDNLQSNLGSNYEFPAIDCGTDICEIQAATVNPVGGYSSEEFQNALRVMGQEPWWSTMQLGHPTCTYSGSKNGRALIVCFLAREG